MHGAALSNVVFMPQAAGFVELDHVRNAQSVLSMNPAEHAIRACCAWSHRHATDCVARAQQPTTSILSAVRGSSLALHPLAHVLFPAWTVICTQERNMYQMLAASCGLRSSKIFFDEQAPLSQSAMCSFMLTECCVRSLCAHLYGILVSSNRRLRREHDLIRACAIFKPARCLTAIILTSGLIRSKWSRSSIIILLHRGFLHVCSSAPLWGMYSSWAAPHDSSPLSVMTNGCNMRRILVVCLNFSPRATSNIQ